MEVATAAAYQSAQVLQNYLGGSYEIRKKSEKDLVTAADTASESVIRRTIAGTFPQHSILAEESGLHTGRSDCTWIVDPLDGTTNFAHQLGVFCISIAFAYKGAIVAGVVLNPVSGELFTAAAHRGAQLNGQPIRVSATAHISESLLATGFPYDKVAHMDILMARFRAFLGACQGMRRMGSAALDLCFLACGRFDGYWEQNLKPWDTAAGMLIVNEAGGRVSDFSDQPFDIGKKEILASNGRIHEAMLAVLKTDDQ